MKEACCVTSFNPRADPVGGIYTVIRSKAGVTTEELGDQYCMLGMYNEDCVKLEVEVLEPELSVIKETIEVKVLR